MKKNLIIFIVLACSVAVLLMSGGIVANHYIKQHLENNLIADYSGEEQTIANEVANSIADRFLSLQNTLYAMSLDTNIQSTNPAICNPAILDYYHTLNLGIGNLVRVNTAGIFYCTVDQALQNKPASSLGTYVHQLFSDPQHNPVVSPAIRIPNVPGYVVSMHVPVYDSRHDFIGSMGGALYLNQLSNSLVGTVKFAKTGHASLQDDNGVILYSHKKANVGKNYFSAAIQNQPGANLGPLNQAIYAARKGHSSFVTYTAKNIKKIATVTPVSIVPGHRWIVIVNVPESEVGTTIIHSGLNNAFNTVLAVLGAVIVFALGLLITTSYESYKLQLAKDQFISLVSHQLRTPLTAIRLFSEMLSDPAVGSLNTKQQEYVDKVHLSTVRMIRLVGDILNVSRLELNRLNVDPVSTDIVAFVTSEVDEVRPLAEERKVAIEVHPPKHDLKLSIDQTLYGQVVHNLLTNAIRYSPEDSGIITVTLHQPKRGGCELVISDNGIGIPLKSQKKIFDRFYRAENATQATGDGTGLGLYLVKMILESSGGKIWFTSTEGKGTAFHVRIPRTGMIAKNKTK
jgi:signal transduction histidine kinase